MAALAGAGALGAVGGIIGALAGMGIPEYEAKRYEGRIREGGVLLSVHCDSSDWVRRAKDVLQSTGAQDVALRRRGEGRFRQRRQTHAARPHAPAAAVCWRTTRFATNAGIRTIASTTIASATPVWATMSG